MKNLSLKTLLSATLMAYAGMTALAVNPLPRGLQGEPLGRMRKVTTTQRWSSPENPNKQKRIAPSYSTPQSDSFQYLYGPDGSEWFAVCSYDVEYVELEGGYTTEALIKGYEFTIYDNTFKEIGKVKDNVTFEDGETRCAQVMLDVTVTKKFFNVDDRYEVMVSESMNTKEYVVNTRTKVFSIGGEKENDLDKTIAVIDGYPVDAVNTAKDQWSEEFYITFLTEKYPDPDKEFDDYMDYLAELYQVLTTYKKASTWSEGADVLTVHETPLLNLPGDQMNSPMMLCKNVDGNLTLIYAQYEKSLFIDPTGMGGNEELTPDNRLVIDVYQLDNDYPRTLQHIYTTKIDSEQKNSHNVLYTFYGIGSLMYDGDVDFKHYTSDGRPAFIVTVDDYLINDDDNYNSSYYVYDTDGNRIKTLAEDTFNFVMLSDIAGYEPQAMFIHGGDEMVFEFVDLYSAESKFDVDQGFRGNGLSMTMDRVPTADGYAYAIAVSSGIVDDEDNICAPICWLDMEGELIRIDNIPVGDGVELAQTYISRDALSPYVFNTDQNLEYMILVKRRVNETDQALREEFIIATVDKGAIHTFLPDEEKGEIGTVFLMNGTRPQLIIAYNNNFRYTADAYDLPFTKFAGGNGTAKNPYLIATAGDLMQIGSDITANYKLNADIDCGGATIPKVKDFSGTLDGAGYTISNLTMRGNDNTALFINATEAAFRNLNFHNVKMELDGNGEAAVLVSTAMRSTFENIHVRRLNVSGDNFTGLFGGISGRNWSMSSLKECEVTGADINLPSSPGIGGIAGEIRTSTNINACAFMGSIQGDNTVGGIVGTTTTGDEIISQCHVDAKIKAHNTAGGIVGFLDRSKVSSCYVEGTIEVTEPYKWTKALSAGAIAGELEGDWENKGDVPVSNNVIGVSSITFPELDIEESYPHQLATVHRVVGRTCYNVEPEIIDYDADGNPIYKDQVRLEKGISNNIIVSDLTVIDNDINDDTLEGTTVDKNDVDIQTLKTDFGFLFGKSGDTPWSLKALHAYDPCLYFESIVYIPYLSKTVIKDDTFFLNVEILANDVISEDEVLDNFKCEFNENLLQMTGETIFDGKTLKVGFTAMEKGSTKVSVSVMGASATCTVEITEEMPDAVEIVNGEDFLPIFSDGIVKAEGYSIIIYDLNGKAVMSGRDSLDILSLNKGIYVATVIDATGNRISVKFAK